MNIQQFAISQGLPITTTSKYVRELAERERGAEPVELHGVRISRNGRGGRYAYDVFDSRALGLYLARRTHLGLFPRKALKSLVEVGRLVVSVVHQTHPSLRLYNSSELFRPGKSYWAEVEHAIELADQGGL